MVRSFRFFLGTSPNMQDQVMSPGFFSSFGDLRWDAGLRGVGTHHRAKHTDLAGICRVGGCGDVGRCFRARWRRESLAMLRECEKSPPGKPRARQALLPIQFQTRSQKPGVEARAAGACVPGLAPSLGLRIPPARHLLLRSFGLRGRV